MTGRLLVAGIGNVFLGDDAFGVEVIRRLDPAEFSPDVVIGDYGIRGVHLAYDLLDGGYEGLLLIDAVPLDGPPGTLAVLDVGATTAPPLGQATPGMVAHAMDPLAVLRSFRDLGGTLRRTLLIGCGPERIEEGMGLSPPVAAVLDAAAELVMSTVENEFGREFRSSMEVRG